MGVRSPWCHVHFPTLIKELPLAVRITLISLCKQYDMGLRDLFFLWNQTEGDDRVDQLKSLAAGGVEVLEGEHR